MGGKERYGDVVRFLRHPSGRLVLVLATLTGYLYGAWVGDDGLVFLFGVFTFVVAADGVSMYLWERFDAYFERREANRVEPERELTPHRISRTTKIVVVVGTVMFGLYVVFALVISRLVLS
jgi:hypothetical protein